MTTGYNSHYDGDDLCRLTAILYTAAAWQPEDGGCVHLLDEERRCWWEVQPVADTLVVFRSDKVLHKVMPCHTRRFALTVFMNVQHPPPENDPANLGGFLSGGL